MSIDLNEQDVNVLAAIMRRAGGGSPRAYWCRTVARAILASEWYARHDAQIRGLRGIQFRVDVACDGYSSLTESDVPDSVVCDEDYLQGAHDAAVAIRAALAHPSTDPDG